LGLSVSSELGPKNVQTETLAETRQEGFVLLFVTASNILDILDILDILESVIYVFSIRPFVGAPGLGAESWEDTHPNSHSLQQAGSITV